MMRHGESEPYVAGGHDPLLTERGIAQAQAAALRMHHLPLPPVCIVHSHLERARCTASILNAFSGLPMREDPDLAEVQGNESGEEISSVFRDQMQRGGDQMEGKGGKSLPLRIARAVEAASREQPGPALVVAHWQTFQALGSLYGVTGLGVGNCCLVDFMPLDTGGGFPWRLTAYDDESPQGRPLVPQSADLAGPGLQKLKL